MVCHSLIVLRSFYLRSSCCSCCCCCCSTNQPINQIKLPFRFRADRIGTLPDIAIWIFRKFGLKCLFRSLQKSCFGEFLFMNIIVLSSTLSPKRHFLARNHAFWALSGRCRSYGVTCRRGEKERTKKLRQNLLYSQTPCPSADVNQISHAGSHPGYLPCLWVSERLVENVRDLRGRNFCLSIDKAHRLYNYSLLQPHTSCGPAITSLIQIPAENYFNPSGFKKKFGLGV